MSTSDAFVVGESWLSEHFFTSEARSQSFQAKVLERRATWDAGAAAGAATPLTRFLAERGALQHAMAELSEQVEALAEQTPADRPLDATTLGEDADALAEELVAVLGLDQHGLDRDGLGPLSRFRSPGAETAGPLALVRALPVSSVDDLLAKDGVTLRQPVALVEGGDATRSAARLLSQLFVTDTAAGAPPAFALVTAGRWVLLAEKERWAEGRYLAVDLQTVAERNATGRGGEIDRALAILAAESVAPDADGAIWWHTVLEESVKHTVGVSKELREGVRLSIEIIANDVVARRSDQGLAPLPQDQAQPLAKQALRYLYRILFLLYAEASPELEVLPVGAPEYDAGYSLDRLREITQVAITSEKAQQGTHLYDSLAVLFRLVDQGHAAGDGGLTFSPLRADLFHPRATSFIDETGLGSQALQQVLTHLLLSKEKRGADRGFISYAELGINQLGAVYEGLMSYTGSFAETDLYEVAKGGDPSKGSWVVPAHRAEGISSHDFVKTEDPVTGEPQPVLHRQGTFVFRLSGRDRQQSASYYTPEVLTRFTVGQAIEELLDQDGTTTTADEVLAMTVCEPALGSGAFAIEAVRQLAEQYLERKQRELGQRVDPDDHPKELQKAKAHIALHNVYGVDLNATAVELAEISLWLDTMVAGLDAPWFGLRLRRGNSLIGARRAVYERHQVNDKSWLTTTPREVPLTSMVEDMRAEKVGGGIDGALHHFLLPAEGWGAASEAKEAAALAPDAAKKLKAWRRSLRVKPSRQQLDDLAEIAHRVEVLWQMALRRLEIAEQQASRSIEVWGAKNLPVHGLGGVTREQIEESLADGDGAYRRLRRVMDAWCALWFWPLTADGTRVERDGMTIGAAPPTLDAWIAALQGIVGRAPDLRRKRLPGDLTFATATSWDELGTAEELELDFANARHVADVVEDHPWLEVCGRVCQRQGFFHWNLDMATVFARGGFDLQVGNPPWVRPESDVATLLAESDPWWQLAVKPSTATLTARREETLTLPGAAAVVVDGESQVMATRAFVGDVVSYPHLAGLRPDLYRCFMEVMWRHTSVRGTVGMIHLESHFTDENAGPLRRALYPRLRRHWHFVNELQLFEIQHQKQYGVTVHGRERASADFLQACWLYHPDTVARSLIHSGDGPEPGLKDPEGRWDLRPHAARITKVTGATLTTWRDVLESTTALPGGTRMVYAVNAAAAMTLAAMTRSPRLGSLGLSFSAGWNETTDRQRGRFETIWGVAPSWDATILQGSHLSVGSAFYKAPNRTLLHNTDWTVGDLEALESDAVPVTTYKPAGDDYEYDCAYDDWGTEDEPLPARDYYRIAWRAMAANTGERTLIPAIIPPGPAHLNLIFSAGSPRGDTRALLLAAASLPSLLCDFAVRVAPKSNIIQSVFERLPCIPREFELTQELFLRTLRLNCLTVAYADLFRDAFDPAFAVDSWTSDRPTEKLAVDSDVWTAATPLRRAVDRRQALLEIDALVALSLGISADELCAVYRTQFPVLYGYDRKRDHYDANGRVVPTSVVQVWRTRGDGITAAERTAVHPGSRVAYTYELPFATLDREADMRRAYSAFEERLGARA